MYNSFEYLATITLNLWNDPKSGLMFVKLILLPQVLINSLCVIVNRSKVNRFFVSWRIVVKLC